MKASSVPSDTDQVNHLRRLLIAVVLWLGSVSAFACGPFLFENADLDHFSLLEPGILNSRDWTPFLAYASPAIGHEPSLVAQRVLRLGRAPMTREGLSNLILDFEPGQDPASVEANEAWWMWYFGTIRGLPLEAAGLADLLYEGARPGWLHGADRAYLDLLGQDPQDRRAFETARSQARNLDLPEALRHRYAFWAVRAATLMGDPDTVALFREFSPGPATDLPLARAQGWAASRLAESDPEAALGLWLDLLVRWPELSAQTFSSLATLDPDSWAGVRTPEALVARFFLDGRDFSPETLGALAVAERVAGRDGSWTETVFYAMAEQVEAEAGVFALFGLVDPHEVPPKRLFTGLIDGAEALAGGVQKPTRTWWLTAAYLALFDGDPHRSAGFLSRARALPARNPDQEAQTHLIEALVQMSAEQNSDWSVDLQNQVVWALDWAKTLDRPNSNRGMYHSVVLLAAQKFLARGHNPQAALAFGMVQAGGWSNPYRLRNDDRFWTTGWAPNNPVNLYFDALLSDEDLVAWKTLLATPHLAPLTARLVGHPFLTEGDLTWWQAHRALRRGDGPTAQRLLASLPDLRASKVFPQREFSYSVDLDPLDPAGGRGMVTVGPRALVERMLSIESQARDRPSSQTLLARGQFWFSLQLSGLPLLFSQPPSVIRFVNNNFEYYGYDGRDLDRTTSQVGDFPLGRPGQADQWTQSLAEFYHGDFTVLPRARQAFEAVVARRDNTEAEYQALLFLQALDGNRASALAHPRYDGLPLAQRFRSTCEAF